MNSDACRVELAGGCVDAVDRELESGCAGKLDEAGEVVIEAAWPKLCADRLEGGMIGYLQQARRRRAVPSAKLPVVHHLDLVSSLG